MGMAAAETGTSRNDGAASSRAVCPFCALLCDDLAISRDGGTLRPSNTRCPRAIAGFSRQLPKAAAKLAGREVQLAEALDAAAAILKSARLPLFGGLSSDVDGIRAILTIADKTGGIVDHAMSAAAMRNISVQQSRGWIMSTLTEVRNRADLVIVVGDGIGDSFPRFYERILGPNETMFGELSRHVVLVGSGADKPLVKQGQPVDVIACTQDRIGTFVAALRASLKSTARPAATGIDLQAVEALADRMKAAAYAVIVWSPGLLPAADGDLIVLSIADLLRDLNATQRCAGLTLGGSEGGQTAIGVTAWQTGYPLRVSLATGKPLFDPDRYEIARMIAGGEGDALIWTASIGADLSPPATTIPTVVIGTPGLRLPREPEVFIPVGTPGLDHGGDLIRTDSVVSLHLRQLRDIDLPRVSDVAAGIATRLAI